MQPSRISALRPAQVVSDVESESAGPNLDIAIKHFESSLARRVVDDSQPDGYRLALSGETESAGGDVAFLYDHIFTKSELFNEFGVGIGLYFHGLKLVAGAMFICSLVAICVIFTNSRYNSGLHHSDSRQTPWQLTGSIYGVKRSDLLLNRQGLTDIIITTFLTVFAFAAAFLEQRAVDWIDDGILSTSDYAVEIIDPPSEVTNPTKYYEIFSRFGDICFISIVLNNGDLMTAIARKKYWERMMADMSKGDKIVLESELTIWGKFLQKMFCLYPTAEFLQKKISESVQQFKQAASRDYKPWKVMVIFNLEQDQRKCLTETGHTISRQLGLKSSAHAGDLLTREVQGRVLYTVRAKEPSDVIYENSSAGWWRHLFNLMSYIMCFCLVPIPFIYMSRVKARRWLIAILISIVNAVLPAFVKFVTNKMEYHNSHSDIEKSIFIKLMITRCLNSAVLIFRITTYAGMYELDFLQQLFNIQLIDLIRAPLFRFFDVGTLFRRHVLGRFAKTQAELNKCWENSAEFKLAERYTDNLKTIFTGLFFLVPLPAGIIITTLALVINYSVDKYSLFRIFKSPPTLDKSLTMLSRHFFVVTLWAHVNVSRIYFANWPAEIDSPNKEQVAECGFFVCAISSAMPRNQQYILGLYNYGCVISFVMVVVWLIGDHLRNLFHDHTLSTVPTEETKEEEDCEGAEAAVDESIVQFHRFSSPAVYLPVVHVNGRAVVGVDLNSRLCEGIPTLYVLTDGAEESEETNKHVGVNAETLSVAKLAEFACFLNPDSPDSKRTVDSLFGKMQYFPPKVVFARNTQLAQGAARRRRTTSAAVGGSSNVASRGMQRISVLQLGGGLSDALGSAVKFSRRSILEAGSLVSASRSNSPRTPRLVQVAPSPSSPPPIQITPNANGATAMGRIEEGGSSDGEGDS